MRSISDDNARLLKDATAAAIAALGGTSRAASLMGVASSTMTKYASHGEEWRENFIRLDLAVEMDRRCDHPFLLSAAQRIVTGAGQPSPGPVTASLLLRLDRVLDDVVRVAAEALEDDHIDAGERAEVRRHIVAAKQFLARVDASLAGWT